MAVGSASNSPIRLSGMNSTFDTEAIVKAMSLNTKYKIDSNQQKMQTIKWKQEAYRGVITKLNDLQTKFFNVTSSSNLKSRSLYNTFAATSSSSAVTANAFSSAIEGTYTLNVDKIATAAKISSESALTGRIELNFTEGDTAEKTVDITLGSDKRSFTYTDKADLNAQLAKAFGTSVEGGARVYIDGNDNLLATGNSTLVVTDKNNIIVNGTVSNKITTTSELSQLNFNTPLVGDKFEFSVNGVDFSFDSSTTLGRVMSEVNSSSAGVKMTFSSVSNTFTMTANQTGGGDNIRLEQTQGNILSMLFGVEGSQNVTSKSINSDTIASTAVDVSTFNKNDFLGKSFILNVGGTDVEIAIDSDAKLTSFSDVAAHINTKIKDAKLDSDIKLSVETKTDADTNVTSSVLSFTIADKTKVTLAGDDDGAMAALGFGVGATNAETTTNTTIADAFGVSSSGTITIGAHTMAIDGSTTVEDLMNEFAGFGFAFDENSGRFALAGGDFSSTGSGSLLMQNLLGTSSYSAAATNSVTLGSNAKFTINGEQIEDASNTFVYSGISLTMTKAAEGQGDITVGVNRTGDTAFDSIKSFVEAYNTLLNDLNTEISKKPDSKYTPLTDEMKEGMSESEIEKWEKVAKEGLLYSDDTIEKILSSMRTAINKSVNGLSLSQIGISVSSAWTDKGKLEIDDAKLRAALMEKPDAVAELFTNAEDGLAVQVDNIITKATKSTGVYEDKGTLVQIAGLATGTSALENKLTKQLAAFQKIVDTLKERYENEQDKYWRQFTAMETALSSLNSQSSYLTSMFSSM